MVTVNLEGWGLIQVPARAAASELTMWWPSSYFPVSERVWWRGGDVVWHPDDGSDADEGPDPVIEFHDGDHVVLAPKGYF